MSPAVWAVIFFLILGNALYVAAEFAAVAVQKSQIAPRARSGNSRALGVMSVLEDGIITADVAAEAMGEKISIGPPYFNLVVGPVALLLAMLVAVGPLLSWRRERRPVWRKLALPALIAASLLVVTIILAPGMRLLPRLGFAIAAGLAIASLLPLVGRNPLRTPLATWGMVIAHLGMAVALAGAGLARTARSNTTSCPACAKRSAIAAGASVVIGVVTFFAALFVLSFLAAED